MSNPRLPPLRPTETKQDVPRGSSDPRRGPSSSLNLGLEQENGSSIDTCRAIHALWNQDMKEAAVRMYRVESSLRASQEEVTRRNTQQEEDMLNLRAKVYVLEEKVHMLRNECQTQRHEHRSLSQDLGAELHCTRELIHQMTGDIQSLKENQVRIYVSSFSYYID